MTPSPQPITISELTSAIKNTLEPRFADVRVQGEVSNFKRQSSGHLYFSLKDSGAQISAVMFFGQANRLETLPKEGDQVTVIADLSVYPPHGKYQLIVKELKLTGLGELLLRLEELKKMIAKRGWFDSKRKRPLPSLPKRIGIVTSPTGAAIQDILKVLNRRFTGIHIVLNPVRVQGEGASAEIAQAIIDFNRYELADVLIVGRGGGSIEDLWAFNEEIVAKAIFESTIPIICAVGHETDHTIAEYVADVRAPTPSAAAEMVIAEKTHLLQTLATKKQALIRSLTNEIKKCKIALNACKKAPFLLSPYQILATPMQRLDDLQSQLGKLTSHLFRLRKEKLLSKEKLLHALRPETRLKIYKDRLKRLELELQSLAKRLIPPKRDKLTSLKEHLDAVNPKGLLKKGYAFVLDKKSKSVISTTTKLSEKQQIEIMWADGTATATVEEITHG